MKKNYKTNIGNFEYINKMHIEHLSESHMKSILFLKIKIIHNQISQNHILMSKHMATHVTHLAKSDNWIRDHFFFFQCGNSLDFPP